jgi:hypothetical protein
VLAAGSLAASLLSCSSGLSSEDQATCTHKIVPALTRDVDAQSLVDRVDSAIVAARAARDDVPLSSILIMPVDSEPRFQFMAKDRPLVAVRFDADGQPSADELGSKWPHREPELVTLVDLMLGPSRALSAVQQEYPSASIGSLSLAREDSELVWRALVVIRESQNPQVEIHPRVDNATGQVSVPEAPQP